MYYFFNRFINYDKILNLVLVVFSFLLTTTCLYSQPGGKALNLNLADFGAKPNDGKDDSKAFTNALEKCRNNPGSTLTIFPGSYNFQNKKAMEFEYIRELTDSMERMYRVSSLNQKVSML